MGLIDWWNKRKWRQGFERQLIGKFEMEHPLIRNTPHYCKLTGYRIEYETSVAWPGIFDPNTGKRVGQPYVACRAQCGSGDEGVFCAHRYDEIAKQFSDWYMLEGWR